MSIVKQIPVSGSGASDLTRYVARSKLDHEREGRAARPLFTARAVSRVVGAEITTAEEARAALAPVTRRQQTALQMLAAERATLPLARTTRPGETFPHPLYVAQPAQPNLRLAVGNLNEYRLVTATAEKLGTPLQTYAALHGPPLAVTSPTHATKLAFARAYLAYRLTDDTTRLRNNNRLLRDFDARLTQAHTPDALRDTIKDIRQENYARARDPEHFAGADAEARAYGLPPLRPLNGAQMKHLFLAEAPAHYTAEMRDLRRTASLTARDKQAHIKDLATGQRQPSPALHTLLTEFERTQARHPVQTTRNIKAFLSDYLNPPDSGRPRFSRHNLNELRQQLAPVERDYLYQVIEQTRQAATTHAPVKQHAAQNRPARAEVQRDTPPRPASGPTTPNTPAKTDDLRTALTERITSYLGEVVTTHGAAGLSTPRTSRAHAAQVSQIITETFRERGLAPATYRLNEARITAVAEQLVGSLPHALQQAYPRPTPPGRAARAPHTPQLTTPQTHAPHETPLATVRQATQAALAPLAAPEITGDQAQVAAGSERHAPPVPGVLAAPVPAQTTPQRPQDLAARAHFPPDSRSVLRR